MSGRWALGEFFVLRHAGLPFDWIEELGLGPAAIAAIDASLDASCASTGEVLLEAHRRARLRLQERARDERVQEAVFLSSPDMYRNVWSRYTERGPVPDNARFRRVERQVYTYLQRFCAKSETTSFFGPIGYGEVTEGSGTRVLSTGPQRRRTMLAHWAVTALARAASGDPELVDDVAVRPSAVFAFADGILSGPALMGRRVRLDPLTAAVAERVWAEAESVAALASSLERRCDEIRQSVRRLARVGAVSTDLPVPRVGFELLAALCEEVAALPASPGRDAWLRRLGRLDELRSDFERASFPSRLTLLAELESDFHKATGIPARRGAGEVYADRLMLVEEASSPFRVELGRDLATAIETALGPALELSSAHGDAVQREHGEWAAGLLERLGGDVDLLTYATAATKEAEATTGFAAPRPIPAGIGARAAEVTADVGGGAPAEGARYALPDICLATPDPTDPARHPAIVLSRVHHHLMIWSWLGAFAEASEMDRAARRWLAEEPAAATLTGAELARRNKGFYSFPGPVVALTAAPDGEAEAAQTFRVRLEDGKPVLVDGAGRHRQLYLPLSDLTSYPPFTALAAPLVAHAPLAGEGHHLGRVMVGGAVYQRERWSLRSEELEPAKGIEALRSLRRLVRREGLPRFTFVRSDVERKPYLIDAESPFAAELLQSLARRSRDLTFEEMLPGPDDLWLRDAAGRYTCELRVQLTRSPGEAGRDLEERQRLAHV